MARLRTDFVRGTITNNPLAIGDTTLTSGALASLPVVASPDIAVIILDPAASAPEIVWVTAHSSSATTATITRGQEGSSARAHASGTAWSHGATGDDFPANAFPATAANGDILYGVAATDEYAALAKPATPAGEVLTFVASASAPSWVAAAATSLSAATQQFVEAGAYKGFWALGAPNTRATYADGNLVGLGCGVVEQGTGAVAPDLASGLAGTWLCSTNATNASDAGFNSVHAFESDDITMVWRGILGTGASQNIIIGLNQASASDFADAANILAFRVSGTGVVTGVADNGGSETTRASAFQPDGTTECTLRMEVRSGGTIVRFYVNGAQVGADVTTNIYANGMHMVCGVNNGASGADRTLHVADWYGWREA